MHHFCKDELVATIKKLKLVFAVLCVMTLMTVMLGCSFFRLPQVVELDPTVVKLLDQYDSPESRIIPTIRDTVVTAKYVTVTLEFETRSGQEVLEIAAPLLAPTVEEAMANTTTYQVPLTNGKGTYTAVFPRPTKEPPWALYVVLKSVIGGMQSEERMSFGISP